MPQPMLVTLKQQKLVSHSLRRDIIHLLFHTLMTANDVLIKYTSAYPQEKQHQNEYQLTFAIVQKEAPQQ